MLFLVQKIEKPKFSSPRSTEAHALHKLCYIWKLCSLKSHSRLIFPLTPTLLNPQKLEKNGSKLWSSSDPPSCLLNGGFHCLCLGWRELGNYGNSPTSTREGGEDAQGKWVHQIEAL